MQAPSELDLATLLVKTLNLELNAAEIKSSDPLFGEGLGLDSIDGLEIGMAVKKEYGVTIENSDVKNIFKSLKSLHEFITNKIEQV